MLSVGFILHLYIASPVPNRLYVTTPPDLSRFQTVRMECLSIFGKFQKLAWKFLQD